MVELVHRRGSDVHARRRRPAGARDPGISRLYVEPAVADYGWVVAGASSPSVAILDTPRIRVVGSAVPDADTSSGGAGCGDSRPVAATAAPASAEIVFLTSGRTLSVKSHRLDGDAIVLALRSGGEVTCERSIVERIVPDEVPYPEPLASADGRPGAPGAGSPVLEIHPYGEIIASVSEAHGVDPAARARAHPGRIGLPADGASPEGGHGAHAADALDGPRVQGPQPLRSQGEHRGRHQAPQGAHRPVRRASSWRWRPTTQGKARSRSSKGCPRTGKPATTSRRSCRWLGSGSAAGAAPAHPKILATRPVFLSKFMRAAELRGRACYIIRGLNGR